VASTLAEQAVRYGIVERAELDGMADAWRRWGAEADAVLVILHGEVVARVA
jgi:hypothetical protein